ncbi:MAG: (5-formylfuran-3-yl)methyl phosphate synthase [Hyphomicrobiaceae bacterium]
MTQFLASVTTVEEAQLAASCGADIVDCKDPSRGALGALSLKTVAAIRDALPSSVILSATIGDLAAEPGPVTQATLAMGQSGTDIVKIGFFPGGDARATIASLARDDLKHISLVGLLLADRDPDFTLIHDMADAGFAGVMLDTEGKASGGLRNHLTEPALSQFIALARNRGLFAGFAGSLALSDIAPLMRLKPNVLGFRGALCAGKIRTGSLSPEAIRAVAAEMARHRGHETTTPETAGATK